MPSPFEMGKAIGGNVSGGIRQGVETSGIDKILQAAQQTNDPAEISNVMGQILNRVSPENRPMIEKALTDRSKQLQQNKAAEYLQSQGIDPNIMSLGPDAVKEYIKQKASKDAEIEKENKTERLMFKKAQIDAEFKSKDITDYRTNLQTRVGVATGIQPAVESARQYKNSPSRFIKGTEANKALKDLAIRAFGFYKPMFGGKLTVSEFQEGLNALSSDKATPGGYDQALNLIESMIKQATMEDDFFAQNIEEGMTPYKAMRQARKQMEQNADQITNILKGAKNKTPNKTPKKATTTEKFTVDGVEYKIPIERVAEFKKAKGIK